MEYDESYMIMAKYVLAELKRYSGETYADGFTTPVDTSRLAVAIQRQVEHWQMDGCDHTPLCKPEVE